MAAIACHEHDGDMVCLSARQAASIALALTS
jgi:hypothetical protein